MGTWTEPAWLNFLLQAGLIILVISVIYAIIAYSNTDKIIFKTVVASGTLPENVIAYYYLPAAIIKITAVAKAEIITDAATNDFRSATLKELNITAITELLPDTSQLLVLTYPGNTFVKDDIKISADESGLLSNASVVAEDRFSHIISALFKAPSEILNKGEAALAAADTIPDVKSAIKEYTKEFIILPAGIKAGTTNPFQWMIDIPDTAGKKTELDASFKVTFSSLMPVTGATTVVKDTVSGGNGIYVRPPVVLQAGVLPDNKNPLPKIEVSTAIITVPDINRAILIPVTRAAMVEKKQTLTLKKGMLQDNAITKPSEAEATLAIPVNMLKAIFSIPAQLLSFRISHVQQLLNAEKDTIASQKDIIKTQQDLLQAQHDLAALRKKINPAGQ